MHAAEMKDERESTAITLPHMFVLNHNFSKFVLTMDTASKPLGDSSSHRLRTKGCPPLQFAWPPSLPLFDFLPPTKQSCSEQRKPQLTRKGETRPLKFFSWLEPSPARASAPHKRNLWATVSEDFCELISFILRIKLVTSEEKKGRKETSKT